MSHTPEPWTFDETSGLVTNESGMAIADCDFISGLPGGAVNARRIVACVNACAGISTEKLESNGGLLWFANDAYQLHERMERLEMLEQQRDKMSHQVALANGAVILARQQRDELVGLLEVARYWYGPSGRFSCEPGLSNALANPLWPNKHNGSKGPLWDAVDEAIAKHRETV